MRVTRRSLLAVPAVLAPDLPGAGLTTRGAVGGAPLQAETLVLDPWGDGHVLLRRSGGGDGLILPALRARIAARVMLAGRQLTLTAFAADPDAQSALDLLAVTSLAAGSPPRLIGLEILEYRHAEGTRLATTLAATSDGMRLVFSRVASVTVSTTLVTHATWKDFLMWSGDAAPLADAPIHPPPPRSFAELLSIRRFRVRVALSGDVAEITPELLRDTYLQQKLRL
jgi:hypothetical protein